MDWTHSNSSPLKSTSMPEKVNAWPKNNNCTLGTSSAKLHFTIYHPSSSLRPFPISIKLQIPLLASVVSFFLSIENSESVRLCLPWSGQISLRSSSSSTTAFLSTFPQPHPTLQTQSVQAEKPREARQVKAAAAQPWPSSSSHQPTTTSPSALYNVRSTAVCSRDKSPQNGILRTIQLYYYYYMKRHSAI